MSIRPNHHYLSHSFPLARIAAVAGAAAVTLTLVAGPASAEPAGTESATTPSSPPSASLPTATDPGTTGDAREAVVQAYQNAYPDLSADAAEAAAEAWARVEPLQADVTATPETFGGAWFDPDETVFHLAFTEPAPAARAEALAEDLGVRARTHQVARSFAELHEIAHTLRTSDGQVARAAGDHVGIDVAANEVVAAVAPGTVAHHAGADVPAGVRLEQREPVAVTPDVCHDRRDCDDSLRSGLVLRNQDYWCSAGFTARDESGTRWVLTSGHCAGLSTWSTGGTNNTDIGPMTHAIDSGVVDAGRIRVDDPGYAADTTGRIYMHNATDRWLPVDGVATAMSDYWQGQTVCLAARYTDPDASTNPCGVIDAVSDPNVRGMVRVDGYDACNGDSGGGWYRFIENTSGVHDRIAFGLHSRSSQGCNAQAETSWFSPLPEFYSDLTYETG